MESIDYQTITYEHKNGVATIALNRPTAYNAFTAEMNKEIIKALKVASKDRDVRCIVMTGTGKAFCAGEDLGGVDENTDHAAFLRKRYHPMMKAIKEVPKPIVAAVNGTAAGAGMSLALAADFRLVQPKTKFVSAFMNIGLIPDSGFMYVLPRLIGYAKALEIAVLGKPITGEEAYKLGLATKMIEPTEWDEKVHEFALSMAGLSTKAFGLIKRYMMDGMNLSFDEVLEQEAQAQRIAGMSQDHLEGLNAFKEKRRAEFSGN
ncbi:2-(1,2-epoxy-1,2-dihydrophenyl)acetyl-CoA isomerase [Virgibacillus profundi]|uniref:2-(1,2-epoxy-1,2-dihydrophenyl)acetyl-CoA isomerase n=1 Tax=Virgibacillus profundi TaxID=2024555 RepID=A0A2A2IA67_9BACI|nr:enoyl-CoA hydratase-related protein [Virgibacillus profundi]PAV28901.1 2-(1,2-epoxy-1,2-dihydrophenyl)acetyl-CoA isomerase [Virgibacillus profundi]PXY53069.1 2-(1,2-epoxy-1,2-dihydrophenyl)acetyl-CoA isomerase [Virgibacillus profundi]